MPFTRSEVATLGEWDEMHFRGTDGTGGGGHHHAADVDDASHFPAWVDTIDDLQRIQDSALAGVHAVRLSDVGTYQFRAHVNMNGTSMIIDVIVDKFGTPVTVYPVNGDFVVRWFENRASQPLPFDFDTLLGWKS